jgi:riboflavin kinase / FMN adenylyltransferase
MRQFDGLAGVSLSDLPVHLAIGMFDGIHLGHQTVISAAIQSAQSSGGIAGVLTFSRHPSRLFRPENPTLMILGRDAKRRVLDRFALDFLIEQDFSAEFAQISAQDFLPLLQRSLPRLAAIYVGENWRFGRGRLGDVPLLIAESRRVGVDVVSAPRLNHDGIPISSSRIRELILAGKMGEANALLGYSYFSEGTVQAGRRLGFPTLNLDWAPELQPHYGVYAVSVVDAQGATSLGVANYGLRPTVEQGTNRPLLEVHILGETKLGAGSKVTVHWLHYLRSEKKFSGVEELAVQIAQDRQNALLFFGKFAQN